MQELNCASSRYYINIRPYLITDPPLLVLEIEGTLNKQIDCAYDGHTTKPSNEEILSEYANEHGAQPSKEKKLLALNAVLRSHVDKLRTVRLNNMHNLF